MLFVLSLVEVLYVYESIQHWSDCMMEKVPAMLENKTFQM